jgi:hypothetical protein
MTPATTSSADSAERLHAAATCYVPPLDDAELALRNAAAVRLLDSWESEGDEEEQRETMQILRRVLGTERSASSRNLFP